MWGFKNTWVVLTYFFHFLIPKELLSRHKCILTLLLTSLLCMTTSTTVTTWSPMSQSVKNNEATHRTGNWLRRWLDCFLWPGSGLFYLYPFWNSSIVKNGLQVSTPSRTSDSGSKSSDWLFPMSETSAPAVHRYRLLNCTRFHGPEATHSSFCRGDYRAGQMASRMHLGTAVATAHSSPQHTPHRAYFSSNSSLLEIKGAQLKANRWHR